MVITVEFDFDGVGQSNSRLVQLVGCREALVVSVFDPVRFCLVGALGSLCLMGCPKTVDRKPDRIKIHLEDIKPVPEPVKGLVMPVPDPQTQEHEQCYADLGIGTDLYLFDENKALAAGELRVYSQEVYDTSKYNSMMCEGSLGLLEQELLRLSKENELLHQERNSWWNQNKSTVLGVSMFLLGAAATVAITHGVD